METTEAIPAYIPDLFVKKKESHPVAMDGVGSAFFVAVNRACFKSVINNENKVYFTTDTTEFENPGELMNNSSYLVVHPPESLAGLAVVPSALSGATPVYPYYNVGATPSTSNKMGTLYFGNTPNYMTLILGAHGFATSYYDAVGNDEDLTYFKYSHVGRCTINRVEINQTQYPTRVYVGFMPNDRNYNDSNDTSPQSPEGTFVDNIRPRNVTHQNNVTTGGSMPWVTFTIPLTTNISPATQQGADLAMFNGFLKRSAMHKRAQDIEPSDIVAGILLKNIHNGSSWIPTWAAYINGSVLTNDSSAPMTGNFASYLMHKYIIGFRVSESGSTPSEAANAARFQGGYEVKIGLHAHANVAGGGASLGATREESLTRTVDFKGSVYAHITDMNWVGSNLDGASGQAYSSSYWDNPSAATKVFGASHDSIGGFWQDEIKCVEDIFSVPPYSE